MKCFHQCWLVELWQFFLTSWKRLFDSHASFSQSVSQSLTRCVKVRKVCEIWTFLFVHLFTRGLSLNSESRHFRHGSLCSSVIWNAFFSFLHIQSVAVFLGGGKSLRRSLNAPPFNTFQIKLKWKKHRKGLVNEVEINNKRLLQAPGCCKAGTNNTAVIAGDPVEQCLCYHHSARLRDAQKYLDQKE